MKRFYYVYRITCRHPQSVEKYYYGSRSSKVPPEEDIRYWSSSKYVHEAMKTFGSEWFKKKILACYSIQQQALLKEIKLHTYFNVKSHPFFFNRANQTVVGFSTNQPLTGEQKQKLREKALGRVHSKETKQKMSLARRGQKRTLLSESHRQNISQALLNKHPSLATRQKMAESRAKLKRMVPHSEQTKQKISIKLKKLWEKRKKNQETHVCPYCGKVGRAPGIFIWHFQRCKQYWE